MAKKLIYNIVARLNKRYNFDQLNKINRKHRIYDQFSRQSKFYLEFSRPS